MQSIRILGLVIASTLLFSPVVDAQFCPPGGGNSGGNNSGGNGSGSGGSGSGGGRSTGAGGSSGNTGSGGSINNTGGNRSGPRTSRSAPLIKSGRAAGRETSMTGAATGRTGGGVRGGSGRSGGSTGGSMGSCGLSGRSLDSWDTWWARNQDAFLWDGVSSTKRSMPMTAAATGLTGRGRSAEPESGLRRSTVYTSIVPALLEVLESGDEPRVVDAAVRALGASVEEPFDGLVSEALIPLLSHSDDNVRVSATLSLGLLGSAEADTLLELARCTPEGHRLVGQTEVPIVLRTAATLAMGYADHPESVGPLIDLVERLPDSEREAKSCAIHAMGLMQNPKAHVAMDYLLSKLHDKRMEPDIRSAIPTALGRQGRADAVGPMLEVLEDRDTDRRVKQSVVIGLGQLARLEQAEVVDALLDVIDDEKDGPTRQGAFRWPMRPRGAAMVPALIL